MPVSAEGLLGEMTKAGVDRAVFVQYYGAYGYDNAYVTDSVGRHSDRAAGVGVIDMLDPEALEMLTDLVVKRGLRGVRMFQTPTEPDAPWLHDPRALSIWDAAREFGVPVVIGRTPSIIDPAGERHLPRLRFFLERYSNVPVALDHMAVIG